MTEAAQDNLERATALCRLSLAFARVERVTRHEDGIRPETDTDHTVMLGVVACDMCDRLEPEGFTFDRGLIAQFALVHDMVEAYAGDVQTLIITDEGRAKKAEREAAAHRRLESEFGKDSWLLRCLRAYEAQATPEAQFIRVLDKVLPKLTHRANGCIAAKGLTDLPGFILSHRNQLASLRASYPQGYLTPVLDLLAEAMFASEEAWAKESD